jgi:hypothetical protein
MENQRNMEEFEKHLDKVMEESKNLGRGLKVGKVFSIPVADNFAFYEVKRIGKNTVNIVNRADLSLDGYRDLILLDGGTFSKSIIERLCI